MKIRDFAEKYGVSPATVANKFTVYFARSQDVENAIQEVEKELAYENEENVPLNETSQIDTLHRDIHLLRQELAETKDALNNERSRCNKAEAHAMQYKLLYDDLLISIENTLEESRKIM